MTKDERQLQELGVFVHGSLASLHVLGAVYNLRRRNWFDLTAHTLAAAYDFWSAGKHAQKMRDR